MTNHARDPEVEINIGPLQFSMTTASGRKFHLRIKTSSRTALPRCRVTTTVSAQGVDHA